MSKHAPGPECLRAHPELCAATKTLGATDYDDAQRKARLWNAAPALLAACRDAEEILRKSGYHERGAVRTAVRAAIASAAPDKGDG